MNLLKMTVVSLSIGCAALLFYLVHDRTAEQGNPTGLPSPASVASGSSLSESPRRLVEKTRDAITRSLTRSTDEQREAIAEAHEVAMCAQYKQDVWGAQVLLEQSVEGANSIQLTGREEGLAAINARLSVSTPFCDGNTRLQKNAYPKLLRAAQLGDMDSAVCYVSAPFPLDADQLSPIGLQEYRKNALALIDIGIRRGDWRFVELMRTAAQRAGMGHRAHDSRSWFHRLVESNAEDAYMYARLEQLGADGAFSDRISDVVNSWRDGLSASDITALNQRASDSFQQYFAKMPSLEEFPTLCGF